MEERVKNFIGAIQSEDNQKILEMLSSGNTVFLVVEAKAEGFGNYLHEVIVPLLGESEKHVRAKRVIERLCQPAHGFSLYLQEGLTEESKEVIDA